jgi:hypothetical protein
LTLNQWALSGDWAMRRGFVNANLMPILAYLRNRPESAEATEKSPHLSAYFERNASRPSFVNTVPPPPPGR